MLSGIQSAYYNPAKSTISYLFAFCLDAETISCSGKEIILASQKIKRFHSDKTPLFIDLTKLKSHADETSPMGGSSSRSREEESEQLESLRFGEWLVRRGLINSQDLFTALHDSYIRTHRLGDALVKLQLLDRGTIEQEAKAHHTFMSFLMTDPEANLPS
jgi:hypothetical protein